MIDLEVKEELRRFYELLERLVSTLETRQVPSEVSNARTGAARGVAADGGSRLREAPKSERGEVLDLQAAAENTPSPRGPRAQKSAPSAGAALLPVQHKPAEEL